MRLHEAETRSRDAEDAEATAPAPRRPAAPGVAPAAPGVAAVRGLIDNASADRLFGWVWDAGHPKARLRVELRLAEQVVAETLADLPRPDLAQHGIGDGCHAFEFPMRPAWIRRGAELAAFAFAGDGTEVPVPVRIRRAPEAQAAARESARLSRTAETVQQAQGAISAELAALRERAAALPDAEAVAAIGTAQQELAHKVEQLELWLTRLDGRLGEVAKRGGRGAGGGGRLDPWQAALIAVAASAASLALGLIAAHRFLGL